jgi:hypothetical protein
VENPFAGVVAADLRPMIEASVEVGRAMSERLRELVGRFGVQSYGKAGIAGLAGEQEHANALLTTAFADPLRAAVGGRAWISSFTKRAPPGTAIDIRSLQGRALRWSHYDGMTVQIPDAPGRRDRGPVLLANRGRLNARAGAQYEDRKGRRRLI